MKKLLLVTMLAVAASWLLTEPHQPGAPKTTLVVFDTNDDVRPPVPPLPPKPPESITTVPWRKGDRPRPKRAPKAQPALLSAPAPESKTMPSWFPKSEDEEEAKAKVDDTGSRVLLGRVSASEDRARQDLRTIVEREVADWLAADIPTSWKVPAPVIDSMSQGSYVQEVTRSLGLTDPETPAVPGLDGLYTLHRAGQKLDFSPSKRAQIIGIYRRDLAAGRMQRLGGGLAMALAGLAVLSGYIKADEATKGYYTNRLRLLAAGGLGVAGVAAYRFLA